MSESTLTTLLAKKQALDAESLRLAAQRDGIIAEINRIAGEEREVNRQIHNAKTWLDLPKAARKRVRAASADDLAAFAKASYGSQEDRWAALGWRKGKDDRSSFRRTTHYSDTKDGTAARILHWRGAAWCDGVEVPDAQR